MWQAMDDMRHISIHALREESDPCLSKCAMMRYYFNPRSP